ncbi:MAG: aldehyde dehydrogenase family protein [Opitutae bacterium]|nr:aldehyde dehydrogenase family protein [Opitutae bacterium]
MAIHTLNPATGKKLRTYREHSPRQCELAVARAQRAFAAWRRTSLGRRTARLRALARELHRQRADFAALATAEMGKPVTQALAEVEKCALGCQFFADHGAAWLADERPAGAPAHRYVTCQPLGVLLAIMPWNFPFWQIYRVAAPALLGGNTVLLKHAANVTGCALLIEASFRRAGFPPGVFQALVVGPEQASALVSHPGVAAVTFTGSTATGKKIAALAGAALKKGVFELGGSDPYLVLADADLALAAEACAAARLYNNGQSCVAAKRLIVVESVRAEFEALLVARLAARRSGDPRAATADLGPLARADLRDRLHAQVRQSVRCGAKLLLGGRVPAGPGFFYPPTVLTGVRPGMAAYDDETFGPVAVVISAPDEAAAVRLANDTPYGLGAAVFTRDRRRGEHIAREQLECGNAFVNEFVRSHPALPFGGVKQSGHGRELGAFGLREFVNCKTVSVG